LQSKQIQSRQTQYGNTVP